MANLGTLKKRGEPAAVPAVGYELEDGWTVYKADCRSWDEADAYRTSIQRDAGMEARIRFRGGFHQVDWKR